MHDLITKKHLFIAFGVFFGLLVIIILDIVVKTYFINGQALPSNPEKFIVANPLNLSQIEGFSKFRSCQGHDNSGKGQDGVIEGNRSMKHYISPRDELRNQLNTIEIFAPYDGEVAMIFNESKGNMMLLTPEGDKQWAMVFFHIDQKEHLKTGVKVRAGELIGHANVKDRHDFDIGLTYTDESLLFEKILKLVRGNSHFPLPKATYLVSYFDYAAPHVIDEYKDAGFNMSEWSYTREYRDQNPCDFDKANIMDGDWVYLPGLSPASRQQQPALEASQPQQAAPAPTPVLYP